MSLGRVYKFQGNATSNTGGGKTLATLLYGAGARCALKAVTFSSTATPADANVQFVIQRFSADGTAGSNPTPVPVNDKDSACVTTAGIAYSAEPTYTSGLIIDSLVVYQRAPYTLRWPDESLQFIAQTSGHGIGIYVATAATAYVVNVDVEFVEI